MQWNIVEVKYKMKKLLFIGKARIGILKLITV